MGTKLVKTPEYRRRNRHKDKTIGKGVRSAKTKYGDGCGIIKKVTNCYNNCGLKIEYYAHKDDRPLRKICDRCKEYGAPGERFHNFPSMPAY